ncbi:MAG: hypothetical protein IGS39_22985 [Calothrix sp. C42_A2020_038]|nr:hypothetical protein [Calothrix sp. C42_A2020_038]
MASLKEYLVSKKSEMFSQKEAELLSGFTRSQLRKLDEAGLVVPNRDTAVLYTWNQLIFLRVLNKLRQDWSFKQLELLFLDYKHSEVGSLDKLIYNIDTNLSAILVVDKDGEVIFDVVKQLKIDNEVTDSNLKKAIASTLNGQKLDEESLKIIAYIAENSLSDSKISIRKRTLVVIPQVIQELIELGKQLNIKDFDLKIGKLLRSDNGIAGRFEGLISVAFMLHFYTLFRFLTVSF